MQKTRILDMFLLAALMAAVAALSGCSNPGGKGVLGWTAADTPPSGLSFSNGMPPSSEGPSPEWYAKRFNRTRGIGEAVKRSHRALWDRDDGSFAYYIGGELYAQFHPWEHYLRIRTDRIDEANLTCLWSEDGALTVSMDNGPAPAEAAETCNLLLDTLARYVTPAGLLSGGL